MGAAALLAASPATGAAAAPKRRRTPVQERALEARRVRRELRGAWAAYVTHAWGTDELAPRSLTGRPFFQTGGPSVGLSIVEAVDTLALAGLADEVARAADWIEREYDPRAPVRVNVFEATIRLLGGLLGAHGATGRAVVLDRARELGDRLLLAYETPTGLPYAEVHLATGEVRGRAVAVAQAGTGPAELTRLSQLTGDPRYEAAGRRALDALDARRFPQTGLLGSVVDVETGQWLDRTATVDAPVDSYYETLHDTWQLTGDDVLRTRRDAELDRALARLTAPAGAGRLRFVPVDGPTGRSVGDRATILQAYLAGLLAQAGRASEGRRLLQTWTDVQGRHPVIPDAVTLPSGATADPAAQLRPEYLDACVHLHLATGDDRYRRLALRHHERTRRHQRAPGGFTIITDTTTTPVTLGDLLPSWWFAENAKYLLLLFDDRARRRLDLRRLVLSTEGHVLAGWR